MAGDDAETIMLTFDELAARLGQREASVRRMVRRKRWRKAAGNDGKARIYVPLAALPEGKPPGQPADKPAGTPHGKPEGNGADKPEGEPHGSAPVAILARHVEWLEAEIERLRTTLDAERAIGQQVASLQTTLALVEQERDRWCALANRPLLARLFGGGKAA
jgi:hypothetical protein